MTEENKENKDKKEKTSGNTYLVYSLIIVAVVMIILNQFLVMNLSNASVTGHVTGQTTGMVSAGSVIPAGVPAVYGKELGISYDDVSAANPQKADATISKLGSYDNSINLDGDKLQRYIAIGSQISCEYCCGAQAIIFSNGKAACGCAHSFAMRGLAKYLLTNHPDMTNDQILEELGKWKTLFFPGIMQQKADILKQKGIPFNYINLASNKYRGIEKGAPSSSGSMVGGC